MCPVCIATAALIAGSAAATGGLTVLAVKTFGKKQAQNNFPAKPETKEDQHG
jgi:hypothetical protein